MGKENDMPPGPPEEAGYTPPPEERQLPQEQEQPLREPTDDDVLEEMRRRVAEAQEQAVVLQTLLNQGKVGEGEIRVYAEDTIADVMNRTNALIKSAEDFIARQEGKPGYERSVEPLKAQITKARELYQSLSKISERDRDLPVETAITILPRRTKPLEVIVSEEETPPGPEAPADPLAGRRKEYRFAVTRADLLAQAAEPLQRKAQAWIDAGPGAVDSPESLQAALADVKKANAARRQVETARQKAEQLYTDLVR